MNSHARIRRRVRMARERPPGMRLAFARIPLERRLPRPFALRTLVFATGRSRRELAGYLDEVAADRDLHEHVAAAEKEYQRLSPEFDAGTLSGQEGELLYALVRAIRPLRIVETGTANGVSTTFLLTALERNGTGTLVSIDLPFFDEDGRLEPVVEGTSIDLYDASPVPPGKQPGWIVPDRLRVRWELRLGDARELLPAAVAEGEVGLFFHDSLHTREHMLFEFETAWPWIASGGVLAADDVFQRRHDALQAFALSVGQSWRTFGGLGFIRKP